jgi:CheY-like chemotaxis protein
MDKRMHGLDGLETTRRIRAEEHASGRPRVPILALSASALEHERGEILEAGCDDFVAKPYRESALFAKMREHLGIDFVYEQDGAPVGEMMALRASGAVNVRELMAADAAQALADAPVVAQAPLRTDPPPPELAASPSGRAVLLVDDDWICRQVGQELLRQAGVQVSVASSGTEALAMVASQSFQLVLMDLQMPGLDGWATAGKLGADPSLPRMPLVAMSADTLDGQRARLTAAGFDDILPKPVERAALARVLSRWLPEAEAAPMAPLPIDATAG